MDKDTKTQFDEIIGKWKPVFGNKDDIVILKELKKLKLEKTFEKKEVVMKRIIWLIENYGIKK